MTPVFFAQTTWSRNLSERCCRAVCLALGLVTMLCAPLAFAAQVVLTNEVQKVETFVDDNGVAQRRLVDADGVVPGDELRYTIRFTNEGAASVDAGSIVITNPIPDDTEYLDGTAFGSGTNITFSTDAGSSFAQPEELTVVKAGAVAPTAAAAKEYTTIRWEFAPELKAGESSHVSFNVRLK
ncbi:MAG: hypothetical protein ACR2PZ_24805 [Pseudomonadales bacterium]